MSDKHWVKVTWDIKNPAGMVIIANRTATSMKDNDKFTNPAVILATVTTAASRVVLAIANKKNGPVAKRELVDSVSDLRDIMVKQAEYVTLKANNNVTIIISSGYEATNVTNDKKTAPLRSGAPSLTSEPNGTVTAIVAPVAGGKTYLFIMAIGNEFPVSVVNGQVCITADTQVYFISSTKHYVTFNRLPPDVHITVGVVVYNTAGYSSMSPLSTTSTII